MLNTDHSKATTFGSLTFIILVGIRQPTHKPTEDNSFGSTLKTEKAPTAITTLELHQNR